MTKYFGHDITFRGNSLYVDNRPVVRDSDLKLLNSDKNNYKKASELITQRDELGKKINILEQNIAKKIKKNLVFCLI